MKICHCIKTTKEENDALHIVLGMLDELRDDDMFSQIVEENIGVSPSDVYFYLQEITAYIEKWQ